MRLIGIVTRRVTWAAMATAVSAGTLGGGGATLHQPALHAVASTCNADAQAFGVAPGPSGTTWFAGGPVVGSFDSSGNTRQFPLPTPGRLAHEIALGPDGNLWFTENPDPNYLLPHTLPITPAIGRVTPSGTITEFAVPIAVTGQGPPVDALAQLGGITAGPDGALWFAVTGAGSIGRITTTGLVVLHPVIGAPVGITRGAGAKLWFTMQGAVNGVGFITTAGVTATFPLKAASGNPNGLTLGPDGNIWIAGSMADGSGAVGITAGPDGRVYFTVNQFSLFSPGGIDVITTSGVLTSGFAAGGSVAGDIAVGGDGRLWGAFISGVVVTTTNGVASGFGVPEPSVPPAVYALVAQTGSALPPQGGTEDVLGERLACVTQVQLGSVAVTPPVPDSSTYLSFTAPPQPAGTVVDVRAIGPSGISPITPGDVLHYLNPPTVTNVSPNQGQVGTPVTIKGSGFTGAQRVWFNDSPAPFQVMDDGDITAVAPQQYPNLVGTVDVQVTDQYGLESTTTASDRFTYLG